MAKSVRLALAALAAAALSVLGGQAWAAADDMGLGDPKAPVTVIEYASTTCPHCAHWDEQVFPAFKKKYVDTGKVRYVLRELPTPPADLAAAGFIIARCAGEKYFDVVDALWKSQDKLYETKDARAWLLAAAAVGGLSEDKAKACVDDQAAVKAFNDRMDENLKLLKVSSTPTFFVNGKQIGEGGVSLEDLDKAIAEATPPAAPAAPAKQPAAKRKKG